MSNLSLNTPRDGYATISLGNLYQCLNTILEKKCLLISKPPIAQLEAISSCPVASYLQEEADSHLPTTLFPD